MKLKELLKLIATVLMLGASVALAVFDPVNDDTDIFLANPSIAAERPNVLIIVDNTANWNQAFANEKNALVQVINGLTDQYNVGLMVMSKAGFKRTGPTGADGAFVRSHVRQMTLANKGRLATIINNFDINDDKGDNNLAGMALYEAYLYFAGKNSRAGDDQYPADHDGTPDVNLQNAVLTDPAVHALPGDAPVAPATTSFPTENALYRSPITDGCQRNFVIFISNGPANENATQRAELEGYLGTLTGVVPPAVITITPNGQQANWADETAKFMANADVFATSAGVPNSDGVQNVYTYVVEVDPSATGQGPDMTALMKSTAANGKGKYFGVTSGASGTAIVDALNAIFTEVQAVNSVFASTTLPVSVNVRGTNLNQVYIGVFRPDPNKSPRWLGNLKMYNLALNTATNTVFLADASNGPPPAVGNQAENSTTGFISQSSPSFWTVGSAFWGFRDASQNGPGGASDLPDGDLVEKGGAAEQLRIAFAGAESSSPGRNLYTCTTGLVNGVNKDCAPSSGFQLSNTPFSTLNDEINAASLQLDTRFVSPLTGFETKPVAALTDRRQATLNNSNPGAVVNVSTMTNSATTRTITNLTTATSKVITTLTSDVQGTQTRTITSIVKLSGNTWTVQAAGTLPSSYVVNASVTFTGFANANWNNVTLTINAVNAGANTFEISRTGNPGSAAAGNSGVPAVTPSTTAFATLGAHGYATGDVLTITGASPIEYNVSNVSIFVTDADHFQYTMLSAPGSTGNATGTITASGNTTTATATTSAAHGFANGDTVLISGASDPAYNGSKTITCAPAPACTGATTFTYSVGATPIGPNTASPVYAVKSAVGGSTLVTVTTTAPHGFFDGDVVVIAGSDVQGYNGTWRIRCPGGCIPLPPVPPALPTAPTVFTFDTATDNVAPTAAIATALPANNSATVTATLAGATISTVTATVTNHGYTAGGQVVIESISTPADTVHPGTYTVSSVVDANTFKYSTTTALTSPVGFFTARPPDASSRAIATVTTHGYAAAQQVVISNANPAAYNGTKTISRVVDADTFEYAITSAPGPNTGSGTTSSLKTTLARATAVGHGFPNGSTVTIAGATPSVFNGAKVITVVDANNFTYTIASPEGDASGTITAAQATGASAERDLIIRWVRGEDNFQDENANLSGSDIRASVHGDVLHSRPAVVNYNRFTGSDDDVFIFYGGNDGVFHAVKGGYSTPSGFTPSGLAPGNEAWGFIASEFFGNFKRLRNNSPAISSAFKRPYFMDGPIGVYTSDACCLADNSPGPNGKLGDTGDVVNLYVANRRGGRFIYALDVNNPVDPKFLWKIRNDTEQPAGSGLFPFAELGQTWSQPTVVTGLAGLSVPVLVFGAGYDSTVEDIDPSTLTSVDTNTDGAATNGSVTNASGTFNRTMGRGIFVVNATTGALIWSAGRTGSGATKEVPGMIYAIPSDVTVVRNETTGIPNRAYVGDTGGNMWRIDFKSDGTLASPNLALTTVTKLASVADQSTVAGRRKFLFPPDVVGQTNPKFDAVLVGSGDREHPFDTVVTNRFYMFKDFGGDAGAVTGATGCDPTITEAAFDTTLCAPPATTTIAGMSDLTSNCLQDAAGCLASETQSAVSTKLGTDRGWFITLLPGEKVVGNAVSIGGTTFFNTNQPSATAGGGTCGSNLGVARQYQVNSSDATATADLNAVGGLTGADRSLIHAGGGYLPSPVHVVVMLGGRPVEAVISGIQVSTPAGATLSARLRKFWYKEIDPK